MSLIGHSIHILNRNVCDWPSWPSLYLVQLFFFFLSFFLNLSWIWGEFFVNFGGLFAQSPWWFLSLVCVYIVGVSLAWNGMLQQSVMILYPSPLSSRHGKQKSAEVIGTNPECSILVLNWLVRSEFTGGQCSQLRSYKSADFLFIFWYVLVKNWRNIAVKFQQSLWNWNSNYSNVFVIQYFLNNFINFDKFPDRFQNTPLSAISCADMPAIYAIGWTSVAVSGRDAFSIQLTVFAIIVQCVFEEITTHETAVTLQICCTNHEELVLMTQVFV